MIAVLRMKLSDSLEAPRQVIEQKLKAIIEGEVIAFPPCSVDVLNRLLFEIHQTVSGQRRSTRYNSCRHAIRKYVATMDRANFPSLAVLLDAEHNATVPIEVELEIAKTLVRKLVALLRPKTPNSEPRLADKLYEIAMLYMNPRLLSRDKFAAVSLNAILSLCLLRSEHAGEVRQALKQLPVLWFSELVLRRASRIEKTLSEKLPPEQATRCTEQLAILNQDA